MQVQDPLRRVVKALAVAAKALAVTLAGWAALAAVSFGTQAASTVGEGTAPNEPGLVRLHVIANSNRPSDQQAKLRAARAVLSEMGYLYRVAPPPARRDAESFLAYVLANRQVLERAAAGAVGTSSVRLEAGLAFFPLTADSQGQLYPAGWYRSVRVVIGEGRGRNWWCVVFPSLCPAERPDEGQSAQAAPAAVPESAPRSPQASPGPYPEATSPGDTSGQAGNAAEGDGSQLAAPAPAPARPQPWWVRFLPWHWFL